MCVLCHCNSFICNFVALELKQDGPMDSAVCLDDMTWNQGNVHITWVYTQDSIAMEIIEHIYSVPITISATFSLLQVPFLQRPRQPQNPL